MPGAREAGPIVATILVRTGDRSFAAATVYFLGTTPSRSGFEFVQGGPDHTGAGPELRLLRLAQRERERLDYTASADEAGQGDGHVLDAENVRGRGTHGQD